MELVELWVKKDVQLKIVCGFNGCVEDEMSELLSDKNKVNVPRFHEMHKHKNLINLGKTRGKVFDLFNGNLDL